VAVDDIGLNYATAFIESLKNDQDVERGSGDLESFSSILEQLPDLAPILDHPGLDLERRLALLNDVLSRFDAHPVTARFMDLVVQNSRVREIPAIRSSFERLRDVRFNVASAEVVTAFPIDEGTRKAWDDKLARLTGKKVKVNYTTDETIIGGAVTRVGSVVYDGSLRKQLERIRGALLGD
jgi:F-type H+-transporting ATPase subunit delta